MPIERLSAEDRFMLWPDKLWPQDIGAVALLDGARLFEADGRFRLEMLRAAVKARLDSVPRFRQLIRIPRRGQGTAFWVDDQAFDIRHHVRVRILPEGAGEPELLAAVEDLRARRLDHSRPLWEIWFLLGLEGQRVGLYVKTHHAVADGIAGMATLVSLLDLEPDAAVQPGKAWTPAPAPSSGELIADNVRARRQALSRRLGGIAHPVTSYRRWREAMPALREVFADEPLPPTSLERLIGPARKLAPVRVDLQLLKDIGHAHGAKVNDVFLAAVTAGLRELLRQRGELDRHQVVRIYVPISLRLAERAHARGNLITQMVVPLPVGEADPRRRLELIAAETAKRKSRARPSLGAFPNNKIAGFVILRAIHRQRINSTTANLPGPEQPLYFAGARLLELFPILPLIGNVSLGIGAISYAGWFNAMVVADRDSYPDLDFFVAGMRGEFRALSSRSAAA